MTSILSSLMFLAELMGVFVMPKWGEEAEMSLKSVRNSQIG